MPAAAIVMIERMSRVRRAGNALTSVRVMALPITVGTTSNGKNTMIAYGANSHPPPYTTP